MLHSVSLKVLLKGRVSVKTRVSLKGWVLRLSLKSSASWPARESRVSAARLPASVLLGPSAARLPATSAAPSASVQYAPFPFSCAGRATRTKFLLSDRLCLMEFCVTTTAPSIQHQPCGSTRGPALQTRKCRSA